MKKIALYLFILAPATLSAMKGYQPYIADQPGHLPTSEELAKGYVPTDADFKAGYVPTLKSMQNKQFKKTHSIPKRITFEAAFPDDSTLEIVFKKGQFATYYIFAPEIPTEKVFARDYIPTRLDIADGYAPDFAELNGNENLTQEKYDDGFVFRSKVPNADGANVTIWTDHDGKYDDSVFFMPITLPDERRLGDDNPDPKQKPSRFPGNGLFTYIARNKLKLGICCGILGILAFVINRYGKTAQKPV